MCFLAWLRFAPVVYFPALGFGYKLSVLSTSCVFPSAWLRLNVFPRSEPVVCFPRLASVHVFPRFGCMFPTLDTCYIFPTLVTGFMFLAVTIGCTLFPGAYLQSHVFPRFGCVPRAWHLLHFSHACHWFRVSSTYRWMHIFLCLVPVAFFCLYFQLFFGGVAKLWHVSSLAFTTRKHRRA